MFNLSPKEVCEKPFFHIVKQGVLDWDFYDKLEKDYPRIEDIPQKKEGKWWRMSRDLVRGDEMYEQLMQKSQAWEKLYKYLNSQEGVDFFTSVFGRYLTQRCAVNPSRARFCDHLESREWLDSVNVDEKIANSKENPDELFCRLDFGIGEVGYLKEPHLDWPHRVVSFLIYFCDAEKAQMQGGSLQLFDKDKKSVKTVVPKRNLGALFLCSPYSWHGVDEIVKTNEPRRCVFITLSSKRRVWNTNTRFTRLKNIFLRN